VPALHALAPTQKEPPFAIAQLLVMLLFIVLTVFAVKRFRAQPVIPLVRAA
jgi:flagellar biogenesis protein FliO